MRTPIYNPDAPSPSGPYSQGIRVGDLLFCAGQGPMDRNGERVGVTFAEQVKQTFDNLEAVAAAAGTSLEHTVRLGVFLRDLSDFASFNELAAARLTMPYPSRTTVSASLPGFDVEVDAIIWIPDSKSPAQAE